MQDSTAHLTTVRCTQIYSVIRSYDDVITFNTDADSTINDLLKRVDFLEKQQTKHGEKLIDVQWRSMRENLIFTGIDEPTLHDGESENVERTLREFLIDDMKIERSIEFDRVHRLGRVESDRKYPRPIIAKFERFKDKEFVRQSAPDVLYGTKYGVREQYPQEIEEKRKLLYPEAKKARQDKENKVRLVRDRLYVNDIEVKVNPQNDDNSQNMQKGQRTERGMRNNWSNGTIHGRTFYPSRNRKPPNIEHNNHQSRMDTEWVPNSEVPVKNRFDILSAIKEGSANRDLSSERKSVKNKASSPIDKDMTFKKHRDDDHISIGSEGPNDTSMETELDGNSAESSSTETTIRIQENDHAHDTERITAVNENLSNSEKENTITADSETPVTAYSEHENQPVQGIPQTPIDLNKTPVRAQQDIMKQNTTPKMQPVNMPSFSGKSNDLYYGPTIITQPQRSPPVVGQSTNDSLNTQNVARNNSESVNRDMGKTEQS